MNYTEYVIEIINRSDTSDSRLKLHLESNVLKNIINESYRGASSIVPYRSWNGDYIFLGYHVVIDDSVVFAELK